MNAPDIVITHATCRFDQHLVFNQQSLQLKGGKTTGLLGPSGVGKSTLLHMIAQLTTQTANITASDNNPIHEKISYLTQTQSLLPWLSVKDNILLGKRLRGDAITSETEQQVIDLLVAVKLTNALTLKPYELSGGMKQRVALARVLMENRPIVLMDEPFSALDAMTRYNMQTLSARLLKNKTVLLVTHDPLEALRMCDDIYSLSGQPAEITHIMSPDTSTPRDPKDPQLLQWHAELLEQLAETHSC